MTTAELIATLVRPLEWDESKTSHSYAAKTALGTYNVFFREGKTFVDLICSFGLRGAIIENAEWFDVDDNGIKLAQAAANAHHLAQIVAALDPQKVEALAELVGAATPYVSPVQDADFGRHMRQHDRLVAVLNKLKGPAQ